VWSERCVYVPKVAGSSLSSGSESTFLSSSLLTEFYTARDSSTWAPIVVDCCDEHVSSQRLEPLNRRCTNHQIDCFLFVFLIWGCGDILIEPDAWNYTLFWFVLCFEFFFKVFLTFSNIFSVICDADISVASTWLRRQRHLSATIRSLPTTRSTSSWRAIGCQESSSSLSSLVRYVFCFLIGYVYLFSDLLLVRYVFSLSAFALIRYICFLPSHWLAN
jgi:hypothetical protein